MSLSRNITKHKLHFEMAVPAEVGGGASWKKGWLNAVRRVLPRPVALNVGLNSVGGSRLQRSWRASEGAGLALG